jgi:hypothetical protein
MTKTSLESTSLPMNLVIAFLTPMLLAATCGNRDQATAMAIETVNAYTARNPAELLLVGEAIALGLGVLSSISLSMAENIPINLILRLRANAASLHRAADQCRRAVARREPIASGYAPPPSDAEPRQETAEVARTSQRVADGHVSPAQPPFPSSTVEAQVPEALDFPRAPAAIEAAFAALVADAEHRISQADTSTKAAGTPIPTAMPRSAPMTEDEYYRACCAAAITDAANEASSESPILPPAERIQTGIRTAALNSTASHLIGNAPLAPR